MTDQKPSAVLGALPRARPHRRSAKRPAPATDTAAEAAITAAPAARRPSRLTQPAQPAGAPAQPSGARPRARGEHKAATKTPAPSGTELLGTAVGAAAELAEIGLTVGARALRNAVSRLPRP